MKTFVAQDLTLTGIVDFLNKKYKQKKTGKPFAVTDVQRYIVRGHLPHYIGGWVIEKSSPFTRYRKFYNIVRRNEKSDK